jgi:creatinine amidohydrolase
MSAMTGRSTSAEVDRNRPPLAILPVGSFEQHGPHLPLWTDALIASEVAARAGERLGAMVLPTVPYGTSAEHRGLPGSVWLREETLAAVIQDLVLGCADSITPRVAVLSGLGGNWVLRPAVRAVNARHSHVSVGLVPERVMWGDLMGEDLHAGDVETSIVMHLDPGSVGSLPDDHVPDVPREALDLLSMEQLTPDGVWGFPSKASAEAGAAAVEQMAARVHDYLATTFVDLATRREQSHP